MINLGSIIQYLEKKNYQVNVSALGRNHIAFTVIPECMRTFSFYVTQTNNFIRAKMSFEFYEHKNMRDLFKTFQPREDLYKSISYYQNGKKIFRNSNGTFVVFYEELGKHYMDVEVDIEKLDEAYYCQAIENLISMFSFAFVHKSFVDTMEIASIATDYWEEESFFSKEWEGYSLHAICANLYLLSFEMLLVQDTNLLIRITSKESDGKLIEEISQRIKCIREIKATLNKSHIELMINNFNRSSDEQVLRSVIRCVNVAVINDLQKSKDSLAAKEDIEINDIRELFPFRTKDDDGNFNNWQTLFTFHIDGKNTDYIIYTDHSRDDEDRLKIHIGKYAPEQTTIDVLPIQTEKEWKLLKSFFDSIMKGEYNNGLYDDVEPVYLVNEDEWHG